MDTQEARQDDYDKASNEWETTLDVIRDLSDNRAWRVAITAVVIAALEAVAIVVMVPLKEKVPYVIREDSVTGVPDILTVLDSKTVTGDEVRDKYWIAKYVQARESYNWQTIQDDYNMVGFLSAPDVATDYGQLFEGEEALDKQYANKYRADVEILSVVPTNDRTGTVRFIKRTRRVGSKDPGTTEKFIATVVYEYRDSSRITESVRLINPYGFQVLSYRIDTEMPGGGS